MRAVYSITSCFANLEDYGSDIIARLAAVGKPVMEAEKTLRIYESALRHLENHERKITAEAKGKSRETKKPTKADGNSN